MRGGISLRGLLVLLLLLVLAACGGSPMRPGAKMERGAQTVSTATDSEAESDDGGFFGGGDAEPMEALAENAPPADPRAEPPPAPPTPPVNANDGTTSKPPVQQTGPLLIYTANYTMAVYEVTESIDEVQALATKMGGYLVRRDNRSITVRVPAAKYRTALADISKIGDVIQHTEEVEDVTEQFFDMLTRLDNAKAMRIRLQELLAAAKDVKDALAVEKELARVTETIERLQGKLKRLRELINFSTITVQFSGRRGENVNSKVNLPFPWLNQLGLGPLLRLR